MLALLFYATGGRDADFAAEEGERRGGWDAESAHFLTGLHECHWVKKSLVRLSIIICIRLVVCEEN